VKVGEAETGQEQLTRPPGEERPLGYAVDLGTEVEARIEKPKQTLARVKAHTGIPYPTTRPVESKTCRAKNRSGQDRTLLIGHPYRPESRLAGEAKAAERARDVDRFDLKLPAPKRAARRSPGGGNSRARSGSRTPTTTLSASGSRTAPPAPPGGR
jgi:hypothetical protein